MALEEIVFNNGDGQNFILKSNNVVYTGKLLDITATQNDENDMFQIELKNRIFINNIIRVR